jgi:LPXTG-motif cell wall-anchored protein
MTVRLLRAIAAVVAMVTVALGAPAPAIAAEGISFSRDGVTWTPSLPSPLFDDAVRWVPGDSRTAVFYLRNDSGADARLQVDVRTRDLDDLMRVGDLEIASRVDDGPWGAVSAPGTHRTADGSAAAGSVHVIEMRVTLPAESDARSQTLRVGFDVLVTLSHEDIGVETSPSGAGLPTTGGTVDAALLLTGASAVMIGGALLAGRRRRRRSRGDDDG